jgi:hypothetical protein
MLSRGGSQTLFHMHFESRAFRKIRLRYPRLELHASVYHMSQNIFFQFILAVGVISNKDKYMPFGPVLRQAYLASQTQKCT